MRTDVFQRKTSMPLFNKRSSVYFAVVCACCLGLLFCIAATFRELCLELRALKTNQRGDQQDAGTGGPQKQQKCANMEVLVRQRNQLSRKANSLIRELNQLQCMAAGASAQTSSTGGWCSNAVKTQHIADDSLIGALKSFLRGKKVASFGDGPGQYKLKLQDSVELYDAFDGAPFSENITNGIVKHLDLSMPQFGLPVYDWIMSLEVAEHIPAEFEAIFLDNISRHAREGVILSWAVPGQGGYSHVNNRPLEYVEAQMSFRCFKRHIADSDFLKKSSTLSWLQRNVNVYRREATNSTLPGSCELDASMA